MLKVPQVLGSASGLQADSGFPRVLGKYGGKRGLSLYVDFKATITDRKGGDETSQDQPKGISFARVLDVSHHMIPF